MRNNCPLFCCYNKELYFEEGENKRNDPCYSSFNSIKFQDEGRYHLLQREN